MGTSIFNLVAITSAAVGDVIPIVDISEAPDITRKITIGDVQKEWFVNVDAGGFNVSNLGIISFDDVNTSLTQSSLNLLYDVHTGGQHQFRVANIAQVTIDNTAFNIVSNRITLANAAEIRWGGSSNREILNDTGGFHFKIETGDTFSFDEQGTPKVTIAGSALTLGTNVNLEVAGNAITFTNDASAPGNNVTYIADIVSSMLFNVPTGDIFGWHINGGTPQMSLSATKLDMFGKDVDNIQNLIHDLSTSGTDVDFAEDELQEISIAANTTFTGTGYAIGKSKVLKITTDATLRTLTFPAGWVFVGAKPADQAASKTGILSLTSFTGAEAGVVASYGVEE